MKSLAFKRIAPSMKIRTKTDEIPDGGAIHETIVALMKDMGARFTPNRQYASPWWAKFSPEMCTIVPPTEAPNTGSIQCMFIRETNANVGVGPELTLSEENALPLFDMCSPIIVSNSIFGVTHWTDVLDNQVADTETFPKKQDKVFKSIKLWPVTVTRSPPVIEPLSGTTALVVGGR
jgi:hypothetical protein